MTAVTSSPVAPDPSLAAAPPPLEPTHTTSAPLPVPVPTEAASSGATHEASTTAETDPPKPQPGATPVAQTAAPTAEPTPAPKLAPSVTTADKVDEEPQNALTQAFAAAEWTALKEFRVCLSRFFS